MQAFDFVAPLLQKLPEQEAQKCTTVVANICKPEQCWLDFFVPEASEAGILQEEGEEQEEAPAAILGANKLNSLKAEFNKATGTLLELLVDLMRGEYLADCRTLAKENVKLAQAVSEVAVQAVPADDQQDSSSCSSLGFVKNLYLVVQAYDTNTKSVSLAAPLPTPSLIQSLNPSISSEQDAADRARVGSKSNQSAASLSLSLWFQSIRKKRSTVLSGTVERFGHTRAISTLPIAL